MTIMGSAHDRRGPGASSSLRRRRPGRQSGREGVDELQRGRILGAMVEVVRERGVANVTVAHIVARSGVSRRTFYELFDNLQECFLAAFDQAVARASVTVVREYERPGKWREKVKSGFTALLEFLEDEPEQGALMIVDALGAGPLALERRAKVLAGLIDAVDQGRHEARPGKGDPQSRLIAEGVVGAVFAVLHARLLEPEPRPFTDLLNPLMAMVVLPYLGPAAARKELDRPPPDGRCNRSPRPHRDPLKDLDMRLTYRTVRVLLAIGEDPGASNCQVARRSDVGDQGQMSKLLARLQSLGLIGNTGNGATRGEPNAWTLTDKGREVRQAIQAQTGR
jgi:AcrR family transcriptional regulator